MTCPIFVFYCTHHAAPSLDCVVLERASRDDNPSSVCDKRKSAGRAGYARRELSPVHADVAARKTVPQIVP